jgi:hypothetical protein
MDPNVSIHEAKSGTCDIRLGRRASRGRTEIDAAVSNPKPEGQPTLHGERLADPGT